MSFQRTSCALQKRGGLSTMSETIRFALRIATAFAPKESHRIVQSGLYKPALHSEQLHRG